MRSAYEVSLLWWAEPRIIRESGPCFLRISCNLVVISLIAVSQLIRFHFPSSSFIGDLSRLSLITCSRAAAPFEHRLPWLIGCSNHGSMLTQVSFSTSAMKPQPTAQLPQIVLICVSFRGFSAPVAAFASLTNEGPIAINPTPIPAAVTKPRRLTLGLRLSIKAGFRSCPSFCITLLSFILLLA